MRPSHLFGTLEAPGQKAYPSKDFDYWKNNPDQGVFEIKQALVRKKTSTGQLFNGANLPLNTMDDYPKYQAGTNWKKLSDTSGAFGDKTKASNPEFISGFGIMPTYPEEEVIKAMLSKPTPPMAAEKVEIKTPMKYDTTMIDVQLKGREKYGVEKMELLTQLGFSEEQIAKAISEEAERDIQRVLKNPALAQEAKVNLQLENMFAAYKASQQRKTGENAEGLAASAGIQNPGVTAYNATAGIQASSIGPVKTGADRMRREMFHTQGKAASIAATKAFALGLLTKPKPVEVQHDRSGPAGADMDSGVPGGIGTGAGGGFTLAAGGGGGGAEAVVAEMKRRAGRPQKPLPEDPEEARKKEKQRQYDLASAAKKKAKAEAKRTAVGEFFGM